MAEDCETCEGTGELCSVCGLIESDCTCAGDPALISCADCDGTGLIEDDEDDD